MKYTFKERFMLPIYKVKYFYRAKLCKKLRIIKRKLHMKDLPHRKLCGSALIERYTCEEKIYDLIMSGKPLMVGRMGGVESTVVPDAIRVEMQGFGRVKRIYAKKHI